MKEIEKKYTTLKTQILEQIDKEHISPHSRLYFLLKTLVGVMGVIVLFSFALYLFSFVLFSLQKSGLLLLSPFGAYGVFSIVNDLPWKIVLLSLLSLLGLLILAKNTFSVYRQPMLYLFLFVIGFVGVSGLLVAKTKVHPFALDHLEKRMQKAPGYKTISGYVTPREHNISFGILTSATTSESFIVLLEDGDQVEVRANGATKFISRNEILSGDRVLIFGERRGGIIFANGVREVSEKERGVIRKEVRPYVEMK